MQTIRPSLALAEGQLALRCLLRNTIAARPYTSSFHDQTLQENKCRQGSVALTPAALLAGAVLGALLEENRKKPRSCSCDSEWWRDPAQCSDASTLWQRAWNVDWDGRAPPTSLPSANPVKTTGQIRHLLFVRHGQYNLDDDEHGLTDLGREQSAKLAQRLLADRLGVKKDRYGEVQIQYRGIWVSNVTRAQQTAEILASYLPDVPLNEPDPLLAEGKPTVPHPTSQAPARTSDYWVDSARMEAGFRKYVHRDVDHKRLAEKQAKREKKLKKELGEGYVPPESMPEKEAEKETEKAEQPQHVYEIYVCHMNLIRYFVMRALQLPPEAWLRLRGDNTGITERLRSDLGSAVRWGLSFVPGQSPAKEGLLRAAGLTCSCLSRQQSALKRIPVACPSCGSLNVPQGSAWHTGDLVPCQECSQPFLPLSSFQVREDLAVLKTAVQLLRDQQERIQYLECLTGKGRGESPSLPAKSSPRPTQEASARRSPEAEHGTALGPARGPMASPHVAPQIMSPREVGHGPLTDSTDSPDASPGHPFLSPCSPSRRLERAADLQEPKLELRAAGSSPLMPKVPACRSNPGGGAAASPKKSQAGDKQPLLMPLLDTQDLLTNSSSSSAPCFHGSKLSRWQMDTEQKTREALQRMRHENFAGGKGRPRKEREEGEIASASESEGSRLTTWDVRPGALVSGQPAPLWAPKAVPAADDKHYLVTYQHHFFSDPSHSIYASSATSYPGPAAMAEEPEPAGPLAEDDHAPAEPRKDLKIILCGDSAVGKSKMVERFLLDDYNPRTLSTFALTLFRHHHTAEDGRRWTIDFWDTAGQEQFDKLHASYYFQANACILAFDVTRKITYKNLETWYKEIRNYCPDIPVVCVANKIDVEPSMAKKRFNFPVTHQLPFYFVSSADGTNVVRVFKEAISLAIKNKENPPDEVMAEIYALLAEDDRPTRAEESETAGYDDAGDPSPVSEGGAPA
ncbi:Rabl2 [Symbiodinium pilosum]|uniref:Serine/threonine-protein phosphatase PGAM5, mitochondrial n=1 Tax=Symbiodinium pilosum TaxID=2952 RepID=A0A812K925_SYMPI|nr:Rabl2 [Symbiodinium pilosum]